MELRHLDYFIAVCEELHFSRAAEKLGISQPNLSLQIKALEEEFGAPLFDRIGKKIALTSAGEALLKHSRNVIAHVQNAYDEMAELRSHRVGLLRLGVIPSEMDYRLTPLFIEFHRRFPMVSLRIFSEADTVKRVLDATIDVGITRIPQPDDRLTVIPLAKEEYGLVVAEGHPLCDRKSVTINELKGIPMITYPSGYWGRELVDDVCREHGFVLNAIVEITSNPSLFRFVAENIGATVQTSHLVQAINDPRLRFIPIGDHAPQRQLGIVYRQDKYLGHAAKSFIENATERLGQSVS